jgi:hypothetical protein
MNNTSYPISTAADFQAVPTATGYAITGTFQLHIPAAAHPDSLEEQIEHVGQELKRQTMQFALKQADNDAVEVAQAANSVLKKRRNTVFLHDPLRKSPYCPQPLT